ncbi:hypothetical protein PTSG_01227 [Salpingoeca rosetta]|uniref:Uncharacterized protein n=1 Tax=Salpingoeca rosetta (strain ATCC 50818 / BSB-021) TaxID=946362 RepID=F2U165_SALR5|nr:uncharacterized protein PTSG_01227 [Salpingoeca rosetta]EGD80639.1 hypothetical protein PTSG_01227 [Salpingoeca rosetta]|eukprot:XP_004997200.1 hypothetical protein PTSG_01227 [Salpingoeca rosetta]
MASRDGEPLVQGTDELWDETDVDAVGTDEEQAWTRQQGAEAEADSSEPPMSSNAAFDDNAFFDDDGEDGEDGDVFDGRKQQTAGKGRRRSTAASAGSSTSFSSSSSSASGARFGEDDTVVVRVIGPTDKDHHHHSFRVHKVPFSKRTISRFISKINDLFGIPPSKLKCRYLDRKWLATFMQDVADNAAVMLASDGPRVQLPD